MPSLRLWDFPPEADQPLADNIRALTFGFETCSVLGICHVEMTENLQKRVLAIDLGEKRVGLALSIPEMSMAKPLKTVDREDVWKELDETFAEHQIGTVVVGLPLRTDGTDGKSVPAVKQFAVDLRARFNVPVKLWDERFTTRSAEQLLRTLGKQPSRERGLADKIAAAMILEEYLSTS